VAFLEKLNFKKQNAYVAEGETRDGEEPLPLFSISIFDSYDMKTL
jgi:hypothetical protein